MLYWNNDKNKKYPDTLNKNIRAFKNFKISKITPSIPKKSQKCIEECSTEIKLKTKKYSDTLNKHTKFSKISQTQKGSLNPLNPKKCKEFSIEIMLKLI